MERIAIEVPSGVAKAWRKLPPAKRKKFARKAAATIGNEVLGNPQQTYLSYLNKLRNKMANRGLTQEILDEILSEGK